MQSNYRLGDIIIQGVNDDLINQCILTEYPNTIGSDYVNMVQKHCINLNDRVIIATQLVSNNIQKISHLFPQDIAESTVVHLRLGDAVGGKTMYERRLRPMDSSYYKSVIPEGNVYVIGKCHFGKADSSNPCGSTNYDECIELSKNHMENVLNVLNATHFDGGHPDIDLCLAVKAKHFVQGKGFYSKLIVEIRRCLGMESIETNSHAAIFN